MRLRARILQYASIAMVAALIAVTVVMMSGSGESTRSMSEVAPAVVSMFQNDKSSESTERYLKKYYGLNASDYEDVVLYFPISNMDAEELLIIKLKDTDQADDVKQAIEERQQSQINIYEGYAPEQLAMCQNAVLDVQDNYILYVVHENAQAIDEAFRAAIK